jgi:hypothetical protein
MNVVLITLLLILLGYLIGLSLGILVLYAWKNFLNKEDKQ